MFARFLDAVHNPRGNSLFVQCALQPKEPECKCDTSELKSGFRDEVDFYRMLLYDPQDKLSVSC